MQDPNQRCASFKRPCAEELARCPCSVCFPVKNAASNPSDAHSRAAAAELYNYNRPLAFGSQMSMLPYMPIPGPSAGSYPPPGMGNRPTYLQPIYVPENRFGLSGGQDLSKHEALHEGHLVQNQALRSVSESAGRFWPSNNVPQDKPRRMRSVFSPHQLERMERHFKQQQYVGSAQRSYIAAQLGLTETQVKVWFQNRRIRWRKQMLDTLVKTS